MLQIKKVPFRSNYLFLEGLRHVKIAAILLPKKFQLPREKKSGDYRVDGVGLYFRQVTHHTGFGLEGVV